MPGESTAHTGQQDAPASAPRGRDDAWAEGGRTNASGMGGGGMGGGGMDGAPMGPGMGGGTPLLKAFGVLRNRNFRFLFASSISQFLGLQMMMIAQPLLVWNLTHSFTITGVMALSFSLPMLLLSLVGGAVADRVDKRTLVLITQSMNGLSALLLGTLIATDIITVQLLFAVGLVQGTMFAFMMPARQAMLRELLPDNQLMNAIALSSAAISATTIIGPAIAGALIVWGGVESAFFLQAAMSLLTLSLLAQLPKGTSHLLAVGEKRRGVMSDIGAGVRYVAGSRTMLMLMAMMMIPSLFAMPHRMMLAGFATEDLGRQSLFSTLLIVAGVGALLGSLIIGALTDHPRKPLLQFMFGLGTAVGMIVLGFGSQVFGVAGAFAGMAILGLTMIAYQTLNTTMIMTVTDPRYMGRVMSIMMLTFSIMPMMTLPLGVAADVTGAGNLFTIMGVGLVVALMLMALFQRRHIFGETPRMVMASEPGEWSADGPHAEPLQPARPIATTAPPLEPVARHDQ